MQAFALQIRTSQFEVANQPNADVIGCGRESELNVHRRVQTVANSSARRVAISCPKRG